MGKMKQLLDDNDNMEELTKRVRNETIDEIVAEIEKFRWAFGIDTVQSFTVFIKGLKE